MVPIWSWFSEFFSPTYWNTIVKLNEFNFFKYRWLKWRVSRGFFYNPWAKRGRKLFVQHCTDNLRGLIFKIQPFRNPSIFDNIICVPISKVLPKGMSNHPDLEIFRTSSKIWRIRFFFSKFKISCEKNLLLVASMGYLSIKILT